MTIPPKLQRWAEHTKISLRELIWVGGLIAAALAWVDSRYVHAGEFKDYQQTVERRMLERDRRQIEAEILKLEVKRDVYPQEFNAVDKAVLRKNTEQLRHINNDLRELQRTK